ncbi:NAD(P)H-binding protein [Paenibacillus sp. FSL K6-1558]|uniref:NAD(P)H-binding protein n=1 Tax=Paenibacillus sp. FSL K6-1558 TaxID=2921473 RepID=UPI0021C1A43D|nr:NAD(P)H-binding protein [Paenibacillus xylanexedens]
MLETPKKISLKHPNLSLVQGDLSNTSTIEKAVAESDVVISTLGPASDMSRKLKGTPIADGHERIIKTMNKLNKKRLITLATPALQSDDDKKNISTILPGVLAKVFLPNGYAEMKKLEGMIKESKLNWTVVRIINPNVKYKGQSYDYSFGDKPAKLGVSRENVAKFMYSAARDNQLIRKMPIIYNK